MTTAPDDVLHLLRQRGRSPDPAALECLMRGVVAAPEGLAGPEWVELFDPQPDAALTNALTAWRAEMAKVDDGLHASPAPAGRLADLRAELKRRGLDGFVVPRADEHQGEYVPRRSQRLGWLTGFSGSAGLAIVLADKAAIFIDGRYTLAVRAQVDTDAFVPHQIPEDSPDAWIAANLPKGGKLGFDPWLQTVDGHDRFARAARAGRRQLRRRSSRTRSTPCGPTVPRRRSRRCCRIRSSSPARPASSAAAASPTSSPRRAPTWRCSPRPIRSPGC